MFAWSEPCEVFDECGDFIGTNIMSFEFREDVFAQCVDLMHAVRGKSAALYCICFAALSKCMTKQGNLHRCLLQAEKQILAKSYFTVTSAR